MYRRPLIATVAAVALAVTACSTTPAANNSGSSGGTAGAPAKVSLQLQWVAQGQFAGYYAAVDKGYYKDAGLDVTIKEGGVDIVPQTVLAQGQADYAIAWVPKALASREQGAEITDVAQVFQRSGTRQVSFKAKNITAPADFKGKKIGNWGFGNEFELFAGMTQAGLKPASDVTLVQQQFDMQALLKGDIDAAQAMSYNEYAQVLEAKNPATGQLYQPADFNVINWNDDGTAMLQDAIWADTERLESDEEYADTAVKLIQGAILGWIDQRDDPQAAADAVTAAGSTLGTSHQLWMANEINKLIWPSTSGIGHINEDQWNATVEMALATKNQDGAQVITTDPPESAFTNEYVDKALDALKGDDVDVTGEDYEPVEVELAEGGN
jgi:NitT/TauT family transport system substrate-binding protein